METIFFNPSTIKAFLKVNKKDLNKYYELLEGFILSNFYKDIWKTDTIIGFKLKEKYAPEIPDKGTTDLLTVETILNNMLDTNTPVDLIISPEKIKTIARRSNKGIAFQLKRFYKNNNGDCTTPLIEYLNKEIKAKYTKTNTSLFIIPITANYIDLVKVSKKFNPEKLPFSSVMFSIIFNNYVYLGEIWPNPGMNKYRPEHLL